jgi:hypothetical protein
MSTKPEIAAHNALTALQTFYGEWVAKQEAENAELRKVSTAMAAELKQAANRFAAIGRLVGEVMSAVRTLPAADDGLDGVDASMARIFNKLEAIDAELRKK